MIQNIHQLLVQSISLAEQELQSFQETKGLYDLKAEVVSSLFRQVIELSIGVKVTAENGLRTPSEINYRGFLESYLAFKYILVDPAKTNDRAMAYKVGYHLQQIESANGMIALEAKMQINKPHLEKAIQLHTEIINKAEYSDTLNEFNNLKKSYYPNWYSLFSGPKTLKGLAEELEGAGSLLYRIYGALSTSAHSHTAIRAQTGSRLLPIQSTFDPNNDTFNLNVIATFLTSAIKRFTKDLYPEFEDKLNSYLAEYKQYKEKNKEE